MVGARMATLKRQDTLIHFSNKISDTSIDVSGKTQPEAAKLMNVGTATVQRARVVLDHGIPELVKAVEDGRMVGARIATLSREDTLTHFPNKISDRSIDPSVPTQSQAAQALNVGTTTIRRAKVVLDHGIPKLVKAVEEGRVEAIRHYDQNRGNAPAG